MTTHDNCIVITGAAGALGSALARHLGGKGYSLALLDAPAQAERLYAVGRELRATALAMDVAQRSAWVDALKRIEQDVGPPVGAALVAGGWTGGKPLHAEAGDETWRAMMQVNLETTHASLRSLLPGMVARGCGSIVVIGARAAELPATGASSAAYTAAKAGVVALAKAVAAEVLPSNVRVNAVLPSIIDTPANRAAMPGSDFKRWVGAASLAAVIAFLLSDDARDVSGAAIPVYGRS